MLFLLSCSSDGAKTDDMESSDSGNASESGDYSVANLNADDRYKAAIEGYTAGCKIVDVGETVVLDDYAYTVKNVSMTKRQGNWIDTMGETELDASGDIINGFTYVIVELEVERIAENEDYIFNWTNVMLCWFDLEGVVEGTDSTGIVGVTEMTDPDSGREKLQLGDVSTKSLVYGVEDSYLVEDMQFVIDICFTGGKKEDIVDKFCDIYLDTLVEELN